MKNHTRKSSFVLTLAAGTLALAAAGNAAASTSPNFDSAGVSYVHFDLVNDTISGHKTCGFITTQHIVPAW